MLNNLGCPSRCLVNCEETRYTVTLSSAATPGHAAFCGGYPDFAAQVACYLREPGTCMDAKVCQRLDLFRGDPADALQLRKMESLCTPDAKEALEACRDRVDMMRTNPSPELIQCLNDTFDLEQLGRIKEDFGAYVRCSFRPGSCRSRY